MSARETQIVRDPSKLRFLTDAARLSGDRVGLVPTMGALHSGHLSLVDEAVRCCDLAVVSVFVNPTQFGPGEDFERYPRDLERDAAALCERGVALIFAPEVDALYPEGHSTSVRVSGLSAGLCGANRPGHFEGVATIVTKLFNIVGPCRAIFGRKDYQQLKVIERMVADLDMPVEVAGLPTVRERDGLALSSRNAYLSAEQRARALSLSRGLAAAHALWRDGERSVGALREAALIPVQRSADRVDYVTAADPQTLFELDDGDFAPGKLLIAAAARVGPTRLIDNTVLGEDSPPGSASEEE
ncbi:MAG: pantoate--beta-alanine ligase [Polyangia bacterium]